MELGAYQLQIFLSLFVVLGAAFVALVCDLLKGNNEQLRELNVELKVRREEEQKRYEILLNSKAQTERQSAAAAEAVPAVAEARTAERPARAQRVERKRAIAQEALAAMERGAQMASVPRRRLVPDIAAEAAAVEHVVEHVLEQVVEQATEAPAATAMSAMSRPAANAPAAMSTRDWSSLLNRRPVTSQAPAAAAGRNDLLEAVVEATGSSAPQASSMPVLPAGFQDGFVLSRMVERRQPVSGLVVSIGVTAQQRDENAPAENFPAAVRSLVESLLGPEDFAAPSSAEDYLLIYPGVRGAAAQRRLSEVAQQLWDFQLRSMGKFSVLFSWGGVEVRSESIEEAIASATERMNQTRRGRKVLSMGSELRNSLPKAG